ncbi:MAG: TPMT family class I SAM-dependent methyltransferase [Acidobacteriota bacterium]|nr:TPMT family class I SAM-dependent methyltransferase [Acidobacteriota bacterium]
MSRISSATPASASPSVNDRVRWNQLYLGLGITTLATLILELSLTRIFSVVFYYHFAFLAISIALFGLGSGGVFSYVVVARPGRLYSKLGVLALADAACVVGSLWFILSRPSELGYGTLAAVYIASALPFFLAGTVVSIALSEAIERVDRAYFFDLAGAAAGCLVLIPFLNTFGGPNTVIAAGVFYGIAAAIWFHQAGNFRRRAVAVLVALLLVVLMVANGRMHLLDVRVAKGEKLPPEKFVAWNSFSRVGVTANRGYTSIVIDADAATALADKDWDRLTAKERRDLSHDGPGFPYYLRPGAKTLVIGAGGGYDVARALASGSHDITAVEINPIIANKIMRDRFAQESHRLYFRPEVHLAIEDGRSFVRRSTEKYQVLQATLVDTWASTAAGAFALSENNLYTTDAFYDYLTHLTPDGMLVFTRWGFDPPRESLRLVTLAMDALARLGQSDPARHVMVVRDDASKLYGWGAQDTVLISLEPFADADIARARQLLSETKLEPVYLPGDGSNTPFAQLLTSPNPPAFWRSYRYDVSPVSDDRPFFFYTVQPRDLWNFVMTANTASADYKVNRAIPLLFALIAVSIGATLLILILPRLLLGTRLPKQQGVFLFLMYFLCLGAGYILIQVALIQKFVLLLGHPTYALTVIVFSMLVASGAGSFWSRRVIAGKDARLMRVLAGVAGMVALLAFAAPSLTAGAVSWPLPAKMLITALAIAPAAFLMGMPFPSGLRRLQERHAPSVRWAWSLNAAASVLGSGGAIVLAIYTGLQATLLFGGALYLIALLVILATRVQRS